MIEVKTMGELTEEELRELELEENLHRKDLTQLERDKTLVALASAVKERLSRNASALEPQGPEGFPTSDVENPKGGRKPKPDSQVNVAKEMGVATMTLSEAQRHVQAVAPAPPRGPGMRAQVRQHADLGKRHQTWPRPTLLGKSNTHGKAVSRTTVDG
jgi:hypothetical protein